MCCYIHQQHTHTLQAREWLYMLEQSGHGTGLFFPLFPPRTSRVSFPAISPHLSESEADVSVSSSVPPHVWLLLIPLSLCMYSTGGVLWPPGGQERSSSSGSHEIKITERLKYGCCFQVWKVKPKIKIKIAFLLLGNKVQLYWFQKEVRLNVSLWENDNPSPLIFSLK